MFHKIFFSIVYLCAYALIGCGIAELIGAWDNFDEVVERIVIMVAILSLLLLGAFLWRIAPYVFI